MDAIHTYYGMLLIYAVNAVGTGDAIDDNGIGTGLSMLSVLLILMLLILVSF